MATERTQTLTAPGRPGRPGRGDDARGDVGQPRPLPESGPRRATPEDLVDPALFWRWAAKSLSKTSRPVVAWALTGVGLLAIFLGWFGVSGQALVAKQLPFLISGGIGGIALVAIGAVILGTEDLRKDSGRLDRLEKQIAQLHAVLLARADAPDMSLLEQESGRPSRTTNGRAERDRYGPDADIGELVALPGATTFHRPECAMVEGKTQAETISEREADRLGLKPCRLCDPVPTEG